MKSCEMDGKAEQKSNKMHAPFSCIKEVCMAAMSTSSKFRRIERPRRNPCCLGKTHPSNVGSQASRAEFATIRLSVLTIFNGLVLEG